MKQIVTSAGVVALLEGNGKGASFVTLAGPGSIVAPYSGAGRWRDADHVLVVQGDPGWQDDAVFSLLDIELSTRVVTRVVTRPDLPLDDPGRNAAPQQLAAGAGIAIGSDWPHWTWWNIPGKTPPANAAAKDVDPASGLNVWLSFNDRRQANDVLVYDRAGDLLERIEMPGGVTHLRIRHELLLVVCDGDWYPYHFIPDGSTLFPPPKLPRPRAQCYNPLPVRVGDDWAIAYNIEAPNVGVVQAWDVPTGHLFAAGDPWGFDVLEHSGRLYCGWSIGSGEWPGEGQIITRDPRDAHDLTGLLAPPPPPPLRLPEFPTTSHPMYVLTFARPDAPFTIVDHSGPWDDRVRLRFHTIGRDNLEEAIADCRAHHVPLLAYRDGRDFAPDLVPPIDGVTVFAGIQAYPRRTGGNVGPMESVADSLAAIRLMAEALAHDGHRLAFVAPWYDQSGNWDRQTVLDLQRAVFDLTIEFKAFAICPFVWQRTGTGITDVPIFHASHDRLLAAVPVQPAWPIDAHDPPPPHEDDMPDGINTFSLDDLIGFAFGNGYFQLIDSTKTHPQFQHIADDRTRVFTAARSMWAEWRRVVRHPNAEGFGTYMRQWPTGETAVHLATRMQLELAPGVTPEH